ncbi:uncharacterized protein MONOS_8557 [Monocercomonoides exilis]|uniref:uncharacterized protein n=1 Tax=Monocercomonoides exilis TaxID=2049356 RepID=UPI0035598D96|nr:hypothetical protein MONOS_8557 [Monocercomonoides exilis]|eukprot:MONOS_8557.1-p1 / transcript=MONOS_8557.1 / gene=MONOS_8557 / organism=Monocercomonoides_exilis_PA203 / gene_product=unspecified product / transcript_product=unspecified product / location=Mono_scaffold00325:51342-52052(-) / protein_length=215 / sequence_SO=supercontig / SO=protein_coding / is_pseudo=false
MLCGINISEEILSICICSLLKVALTEEENEEIRKEEEMALLSLSNVGVTTEAKKELYLNEITEIINRHQKLRYLSPLAYQSAWEFLINRYSKEKELAKLISKRLKFVEEAMKELEEQTTCMSWKEKGGERKESRESITIMRWCILISRFMTCCKSNELTHFEMIRCVVKTIQKAEGNYVEIDVECIRILKFIMPNGREAVYDLLKGGAIDIIFL